MINTETIRVMAIWDNEARVWVATSEDAPGLITESETSEKLIQKLKILIPELLEANDMLNKFGGVEIPFHPKYAAAYSQTMHPGEMKNRENRIDQ